MVGTLLSDKLTTSTGSPQDCVFSLMLFIRYTNSCTNTTTTSVNLLNDGKEQHGPDPDHFIKCCEVRPCSQHSKDFRGQQSSQPTITKQLIQSVTEYQYLCSYSWPHVKNFSRKLVSFNAGSKMLHMFYCAFTESVLTFLIFCWFGNPSEEH